MDYSDDETSNNLSVIDTSSFCNGDLDMFLDCLEELCKKKKPEKSIKSNRSGRKKRIPLKRIYDSDSSIAGSYDESISNLNLSEFNDTNTSLSTTSNDITFNDDADVTHLTEKFNDIFAYFNEDVVTDTTLFEEEDNANDIDRYINDSSNKENTVDNRSKLFEQKPERHTSAVKEIQHKSSAIFNSIKNYNEINQKNVHENNRINSVKRNEQNKNAINVSRLNYTVSDLPLSNENRLSSASTLSLHDDECNRKYDVKCGKITKLPNTNVREIINFFNSTANESNCNVTLPAMHSQPRNNNDVDDFDDEETNLYRTNSIRRFKQKRDYFEKIFNANKMIPNAMRNDNQISRNEKITFEFNKDKLATEDIHNNPVPKKYDSKLNAVETYVQTQHLLERIQTLVKAISNLDEKRLTTMNLKMLKKFLLFIRDCSYNCQQVCFDISENFLTDFEKNVLSAEELMYTALKAASENQVKRPERPF